MQSALNQNTNISRGGLGSNFNAINQTSYACNSGTGPQNGLNQITGLRRAGLQGAIRSIGQQIGNPFNELPRTGLQTNYASNSRTGVQGGLNRISNLSRAELQNGVPSNYSSSSVQNSLNLSRAGFQGGIPTNNASIYGTEAINPISDDLTRAHHSFKVCKILEPKKTEMREDGQDERASENGVVSLVTWSWRKKKAFLQL